MYHIDGLLERWDDASTVAPAPAVFATPAAPPVPGDIAMPPIKTNHQRELSTNTPKKNGKCMTLHYTYIYIVILRVRRPTIVHNILK